MKSIFLIFLVSFYLVASPSPLPAEVLASDKATWASIGKGDERKNLLILFDSRPMVDASWFVTDKLGIRKIKKPEFVLYEVVTVKVSPDEKRIAILSAGEGHPQITIADAKQVFAGTAKKQTHMIDPYPGYVKLEGWKGNQLVVKSDQPLHMLPPNHDKFEDLGGPEKTYLYDIATKKFTLGMTE